MDIRQTALFAESWNIAYRKKPQGAILNDLVSPFKVVTNAFKYWAADPMIYEYKGITYLFAELYDYKLRRGTIGVSVFDGEKFSSWKQIIVEPFHMSYPFIFQINDEIYMIPETNEAQQLRLYRAVEFPYIWEMDRIIQDHVQWLDTTIINEDLGFVGLTQSKDGTILKFNMTCDFQVLGIRVLPNENAQEYRGAGPFFLLCPDRIVRVCQDCRKEYGAGLIFRQYKKNNEEVTVTYLAPDDISFDKRMLINGMHTYSATETLEIIDIKTRRLNLLNLLMRIKGKLR